MHQQNSAARLRPSPEEIAHPSEIGVVPIVGHLGENDQVELSLRGLGGQRHALQRDVGERRTSRSGGLKRRFADIHS